jgi:hypothetical protein
MTPRVQHIIDASEFVGDRYSLPHELATNLAQALLTDVMNLMAETNANSCAYTTYDQAMVECARQVFMEAIRTAYGIEYCIMPPGVTTFPVKAR